MEIWIQHRGPENLPYNYPQQHQHHSQTQNVQIRPLQQTQEMTQSNLIAKNTMEQESTSNNNNNNTNPATNWQSVDNHVPDQMLHLLFQGRNFPPMPFPNTTAASHNSSSPAALDTNGSYSSSSPIPSSTAAIAAATVSGTATATATVENNIDVSSGTLSSGQDTNLSPTSRISNDNNSDKRVPRTTLHRHHDQSHKNLIATNHINIHASVKSHMPKQIMEILDTNPLPKSLDIDNFGIPTTSLAVHPMARYLLNYYIRDLCLPLVSYHPWEKHQMQEMHC
ncbi:unnamed protein product [Ambrosiozyma monospora]|uniref:Unnamed protein product n=1 Tax=Ambrosiozyma monospora TaxID=43982 RepID=A0ACB5U227_AMBMO|nr:unnamed protein product [Ambrosiozyma monospora]